VRSIKRAYHWGLRQSLVVVAMLCLMIVLLSGCDETVAPALHINVPTQPAIHRFDLSARQGLRDPLGDLTAGKSGADTRIVVGDGEKVEIFASGAASVKGDGSQTGPQGDTACRRSTMPLSNLPCYAVVYSIGMAGPASVVGKHAEFTASTSGNLFIGINAPNLTKNSGVFHMTIVTIPRGMAMGLWNAPDNGFLVQGTNVTLSIQAFSQDSSIQIVRFTASMSGQAPITVCDAVLSTTNTYTCSWDLMFGREVLRNGQVSFGFTIYAGGKAIANPDGTRSGMIRYVFTEKSDIYAGYDAANFNQAGTNDDVKAQWTVPRASCAIGENSLSAVWVGLSSRASETSILAQTGTVSGCQNGTPVYNGWWEMFPAPSVSLDNPVTAGDAITASVTYNGGTFNLVMDDITQGWHFATTQTGGRPSDTRFALCVVEAPSLVDPNTNQQTVAALTNFGSVSVKCTVNGGPLGGGPQNDIFQMATDNINKAVTSPLDRTGTTFTVQWRHS